VLIKEQYNDGGISGGHLERPALQRLMDDVEVGRVNRIVIYKIDRLTRSLTDFAELVDRLDGAGASCVSVTQAFNTATSMGRLTLNVLLSFAQFQREVTAERIRDKIAASKKKGLWMGGNVPLGYQSENRTLRVVREEAETVQTLFDLYEQLGTVTAVTREATKLRLKSKLREGRDGSQRGGSLMGRGQIHHVLANQVYAWRIRHKLQSFDGQHDAIIDPGRWETVQASLMGSSAKPRSTPAAAHPSPLAGKLFDETGDRLTPSHASKGGKRYRYYVSLRLVTGGADDGTGRRLPAGQLERDLVRAVQMHLTDCFTRGQIGAGDAPTIKRLRAVADALGDLSLTLIRAAKLRDGTFRIDLDPDALAETTQVTKESIRPETLSLRRPFRQRRRGVETRLVIGQAQPARDDILIANVARAA
jgi:DNA invertase Pin-like site-specific DNA recombinase